MVHQLIQMVLENIVMGRGEHRAGNIENGIRRKSGLFQILLGLDAVDLEP